VPREFVIGTFTNADRLLRAVRAARSENFRVYDVFSPYPVHGLDEAMGIRRTRLPFVTLAVGLMGLTLAISFQFYTNVLDWSLNVGGKPDNSTLAFLPICFELTVLLGGLATVAALFVRARLYPGKRERLPAAGVTNNMFALVLRRPDAPFGVRRAREILEKHGAKEIDEKEADL
jgi:hypothetical protein